MKYWIGCLFISNVLSLLRSISASPADASKLLQPHLTPHDPSTKSVSPICSYSKAVGLHLLIALYHSRFVPFDFDSGGYSYSGTIDTGIDLGYDISTQPSDDIGTLLRDISYEYFGGHPHGAQIGPGDSLDCFVGYLKFSFRWIMQGGPRLTYAMVVQMLNTLANNFTPPHNRQHHPINVVVSEGHNVKFELTVRKILFQNFVVGSGAIIFEGQLFPERQFPEADIRDLIQQSQDEDEDRGLNSIVEPGTYDEVESEEIVLRLRIRPASEELLPPFKNRELRDLQTRILAHFQSERLWCALQGSILYDVGIDIVVGFLYIMENMTLLGQNRTLVKHVAGANESFTSTIQS